MKITSILTTSTTMTILATIEGARFEFTSLRGGPFEVYDFPKSWKGVARFVGHLPAEQTTKLRAISSRVEHDPVRVDRAQYVQPNEFSHPAR